MASDRAVDTAKVRTITADEFPAYVRAVYAGFHHNAHADAAAHLRGRLPLDRTYAAFDAGDVVGTAASFPTELTVPGGGVLTAAGVTSVTVTATHRRQGLLTRMMREQLADVARRNEPVAILIAAEAPIYGRFGYGPATDAVVVRVDAQTARLVDPPRPGSLRRVSAEVLRAEAPAVYERFRLAQVGSIERPSWWWDDHLITAPPGEEQPPGERFFVVHRGSAGAVDGVVWYRVISDWDHRVPRSKLVVDGLVCATDAAYVACWHHCLTVDWVTVVEAPDRAVVEALPVLLADRRAARQVDRSDFVWLRVLDPVVALAGRRYRVADRLVLSVIDPAGFASGTYAVDGGPDGAACRSVAEPADLTIGVADLGAAYLGGTALWPAKVAGRVEEHRTGAVAAFDRMFGTDVPPWCATDF